ncbi:MAG: GGDEF domain-containing protein [Rhodocyclaceae bacterium]|nr:MAG: GGDEF domain-containing protein [Rhodocyclaceae bacterium]
MLLDTKTTLAYYVLTSLTLAVLLLVAFRGRFTPSLRLWLACLGSQALGWFFISLQDLPFPWLTTGAGPVMVSLSYSFLIYAVMTFYGCKARRHWPLWPVPLSIAAVVVWHNDASLRQMAINLIFAIQLSSGAVFIISRRDPHRGLRWLMGTSALVACVLLFIRVLYLAEHRDSIPGLLQPSLFQSLTFSIGFVLRLVFTVGFLLLIEVHRYDELTWLAARDSLTGVYNRRTFIELAEAELARSARYKLPVALLLIDLDHFKQINDTHGHQAGDLVLKQFPEVAERCMRSHDFLGRYGGEEFCVLAPDTDAEGAATLAERLRQGLAEHTLQLPDGRSVHVSASIGVACRRGDGNTSLDELLSAADSALYRAKDGGRNRVVVDGPA